MKNSSYRQVLTVGYEYPVVFTRDVFHPDNPVLADALARRDGPRPQRAVVFVDSGVASHHSALDRRIEQYFASCAGEIELALPPRIVPGGEAIKTTFDEVAKMIRLFLEQGLCRQSYVVAVGGGAVLDAVGFAASLFHRGLRLVRLPTTVLAQNDVGVGVKNAVNFGGAKNTIGTFAPPAAVINDFGFLPTLADRDWIGGIAEAFKVAIIRDAEFFGFLSSHAGVLRDRDQESMEKLIFRCAELHLEHIRTHQDPFEFGRARPLDFGHWAAHKLEVLSGYRLSHGEAVAIGIGIDSHYAMQNGWISDSEFDAIHGGLVRSGFTLWCDELEQRNPDGGLAVFDGIEAFRQHLGGQLFVTFPRGIGNRLEVGEIDTVKAGNAIRHLRELTGRSC